MNWLDAKCNNCGLQREVVVFTEPTKPRSALRCPRCESLNVIEVNSTYHSFTQAEVDSFNKNIQENLQGFEVNINENGEPRLTVLASKTDPKVMQISNEEFSQRFKDWPFTYKPQIIVIAKEKEG